ISNPIPIQAGVPQGSALYIVYCTDFPISDCLRTKTRMYAEDTALWTSQRTARKAEEEIQQQLNKIQKWANSWRVKPNATKSQALLINHPHSQDRRLREPPRLTLNNRLISPSQLPSISSTHVVLNPISKLPSKGSETAQIFSVRSEVDWRAATPKHSIPRPLYAFLPPQLQNQIAFCKRKILPMIFRLHFRHPSHLVHSDTNTISILTRLTPLQQKYIDRTENSNNSLTRQNLRVTFKISLTTRINRHFNFLNAAFSNANFGIRLLPF
ncbi:hypothetical protein BDFB_008633, partial [Asbolus verrucosus]